MNNDKLQNCTGLTFGKGNEIKNYLSHKELQNQGYIIDTCCYPNIAYKGPRFNPSEWFEVLTEKEYIQSTTIRKQGKKIKDFRTLKDACVIVIIRGGLLEAVKSSIGELDVRCIDYDDHINNMNPGDQVTRRTLEHQASKLEDVY